MKYIGMTHFKEDGFRTITATTDEEIKRAGSAGFVKVDERKFGETTISCYKRLEKFSKYVYQDAEIRCSN